MPDMKNICVVGLGYIGLPTASFLATKGYQVRGVDVQETVVDTINAGKIHIAEPDLDVLVRSAIQSGYLEASLEPTEAEVFILAVPTPFKDDHVPDLSFVEAATHKIAPYLQQGNLVILESTSPVGTTEKVAAWVDEQRPDLSSNDLFFAHCPERVLPGQILKELVSNDRIVGGVNRASAQAAASFYKEFVSGEVLITDSRTAELAKLTENTYRDVNIALANELSMICDKLQIDVWELIKLANHHPRVNVLNPGPGVGGHCIAVDPWFIVNSVPEHAKLIKTTREVNQSKPAAVVQNIQAAVSNINNPRISLLGLAYKPNIDDLRESPAVDIALSLASNMSAELRLVEPNICELPESLLQMGLENWSLQEAIADADLVVALVAHDEFYSLSNSLDGISYLDVCGIWS